MANKTKQAHKHIAEGAKTEQQAGPCPNNLPSIPLPNKNALAMQALLAQGLTPPQIAAHLGLHEKYAYELKRKLTSKYGCVTNSLLKKGKAIMHKVADDYLEGKTKRASEAMRLVEMQQSKLYPKAEEERPSHLVLNFTLNQYQVDKGERGYQEKDND